jgi:hypothetical protein
MSMMRCFMMSKGHWNAFSTFWAFKKRFRRIRESDDLSRRMGLRTNLPSGRLKKTIVVKAMNRCFKVSKFHANSFSASWASKKSTWTKLLTWCLNRRMALRIHCLPSGRLKKRPWSSRWRDFWRCRKDIRTHFLHHMHWIKRLVWSRLSDVLGSRMALRTHDLRSGVLKKNNFR